MTFEGLLLFLNLILIVSVFILILTRTGKGKDEEVLSAQEELLDEFEDRITGEISAEVSKIKQDIDSKLAFDAEQNRQSRAELSDMLIKNQERMENSLRASISEMQESNRKKLEDIRGDLNRKLDTSLNERLYSSFRAVGDQLNRLYTSLGELSKLENGVNSLNKTLSNVKTRGIFGEMQLENILSDILPDTLYDKNVVTRKSGGSAGREAVEFAVKIPDKEVNGEFMYLPIDSKFQLTYYDRIVEASERSDSAELKKAVKELENRVKSDAADIRDKYLDPPYTTDFGIMFLPTESLYAEVLRIPGLVEECQSRFHVVITGPSTMAALLNSLNVGFRYMAVNRDSRNVLKLLSAVKTQYQTLAGLIDNAGNRIDLAKKATDELMRRTDIINRRLSSVEEIDPAEAEKLLGTQDDSEFTEIRGPESETPKPDTENFL